MKAIKFSPVVIAALLMISCGPALTLNSLFDESELVSEPALLGSWGEGETLMTFENTSGRTYKMTYSDGSKVSVLEVKLGRIDGELFMDLYPVSKDANQDTEAYAPAVRMHTLMKLEIEDDQLILSPLDSDWVEKQMDRGDFQLDDEHVLKVNDDLFLTLSTDDLQKFVHNHAFDDEAFTRADPLVRVK